MKNFNEFYAKLSQRENLLDIINKASLKSGKALKNWEECIPLFLLILEQYHAWLYQTESD